MSDSDSADLANSQFPAKIELIEIKVEFQDDQSRHDTQPGDPSKRFSNVPGTLRKESQQKYWDAHKAEINRRRRERRREKRDENSARYSKFDAVDREALGKSRQQRYRERHREELKRRQAERRKRLKNDSNKAENVGIFVDEDGIQRWLTIRQADKNTGLADSDALKSDEIGPVEPLRVYLNQDEVVIKEENDYDPFDDIETLAKAEAGHYFDANISKIDSAITTIDRSPVQTNQEFLNHVLHKLNGYDENKAALVRNIIDKILGDADAGLPRPADYYYDASASIQCKREI